MDGVWTNSHTSTHTTRGLNENFLVDRLLSFRSSSNHVFGGYHTAFINTRTNSAGRLRTATYSSSGEITSGDIDGKSYYGGYSLTGPRTNPSRLPFTP